MKSPEAMARILAYDDTAVRVWRDQRMTPGTRELVLAVGLLLDRDPRRLNGREFWRALRDLLGVDHAGRVRYKVLLAEDAPRYTPPVVPGTCRAPRVRPRPAPAAPEPAATTGCVLAHHPHLGPCDHTAPQPATPAPSTTCDAPAAWDLHLWEADPVTGWRTEHHFCRRHRPLYEQTRARIGGGSNPATWPEPIPNTGGLLPCYYATAWEHIYASVQPGWTVPSYGVAADDWPTPGRGRTTRKPRLRVIPGGLAGHGESA